MSQMGAGDQIRGQEQSSYGSYQGNQDYEYQQYSTPSHEGNTVDDNLVEAIAQRIIQRMSQGQGSMGRPTPQSQSRLSAGRRLALGIVSVVMLVPLSAILLNGSGGIFGLVAFGVACFAIAIINAVFNERKTF